MWLLDGRVRTRVREGLRLLLRLGCWSAHGGVHGKRKLGLLLVLLAELLILRIETSSVHLAKKGITKANESHGNPRGKSQKKCPPEGSAAGPAARCPCRCVVCTAPGAATCGSGRQSWDGRPAGAGAAGLAVAEAAAAGRVDPAEAAAVVVAAAAAEAAGACWDY